MIITIRTCELVSARSGPLKNVNKKIVNYPINPVQFSLFPTVFTTSVVCLQGKNKKKENIAVCERYMTRQDKTNTNIAYTYLPYTKLCLRKTLK